MIKNGLATTPLQTEFLILPVIYGFNNGHLGGWSHGVLLSEDGHYLGDHLCSHEGYMPFDLGILEGSRADRHCDFKTVYPNGYRMEFVSLENVAGHAALQKAIKNFDQSHSLPEE